MKKFFDIGPGKIAMFVYGEAIENSLNNQEIGSLTVASVKLKKVLLGK